MTFFDDLEVKDHPRRKSWIARLFETPFDRRSAAIAAEISELRALSDDALKDLGISRDTIVVHVFAKRRRSDA